MAAAGEPGVFGEVRLWNVADGHHRSVGRGGASGSSRPRDSLYAVALAADGKMLATGSYDQQIKLWDAANGKRTAARSSATTTPCSIWRLAPTARCWPAPVPTAPSNCGTWPAASGSTRSASRSRSYTPWPSVPTATRVAAGGVDNRIRVWQISPDGKENTNPILYSRFAHEGAVVKLVYSADGKTTGLRRRRPHGARCGTPTPWSSGCELERQSDWAPALAIGPDGKTIAVGRLDGSLAFYDAATGELDPAAAAAQAAIGHRVDPRRRRRRDQPRQTVRQEPGRRQREIKTSHEKLAAKIVAARRGRTNWRSNLTPAAELPRGRYQIWVVGPGGESGKQPVDVDTFRNRAKPSRTTSLAHANAVTLPAGVWGMLARKGRHRQFCVRRQRRAAAGLRSRGQHHRLEGQRRA